MRLQGWLATAALVGTGLAAASTTAYAGDPLKPYVLMIIDTSTSMRNATGAGVTSCDTPDTRLAHAKCAINNIANSYGDMVLALGRFRETSTHACPLCFW